MPLLPRLSPGPAFHPSHPDPAPVPLPNPAPVPLPSAFAIQPRFLSPGWPVAAAAPGLLPAGRTPVSFEIRPPAGQTGHEQAGQLDGFALALQQPPASLPASRPAAVDTGAACAATAAPAPSEAAVEVAAARTSTEAEASPTVVVVAAAAAFISVAPPEPTPPPPEASSPAPVSIGPFPGRPPVPLFSGEEERVAAVEAAAATCKEAGGSQEVGKGRAITVAGRWEDAVDMWEPELGNLKCGGGGLGFWSDSEEEEEEAAAAEAAARARDCGVIAGMWGCVGDPWEPDWGEGGVGVLGPGWCSGVEAAAAAGGQEDIEGLWLRGD